jgi:hypothetical protein
MYGVVNLLSLLSWQYAAVVLVQQIDSAWRQHGLLKKLDRGELVSSRGNSQERSRSSDRHPSLPDPDACTRRRSRSRSSTGSRSGSGEEQEGRDRGRPSGAPGHHGKHTSINGEENGASGRTANGLRRENGAERSVSTEQNGASHSKLRGFDAVEERAVWAARKVCSGVCAFSVLFGA